PRGTREPATVHRVPGALAAELVRQLPAQRASRHSGRGFPRAATLQRATSVLKAELHRADEISMAGTRSCPRWFTDTGIAVLDAQRNWAPDGLPAHQARDDLDPVCFQLHPHTPAVALLAAEHLRVYVLL